jgi:biotin operon repressor
MKITDLLGVGEANAVSRVELASRAGMSDRKMRAAIQQAREDGELILNAQNGAGYFLASTDDLNAIERQYRQDTARALSILKRRKAMRRLLKEAGRDV